MAQIIKTASFEIAVYMQGDSNAKKLALLLPGRLDTKDYAHMRSHVDHLSEKGYLAVAFDAPGSWDSPGDIELYTMTNILKAVDELIEHFGNKPTVIIGHSRGGSVAMIAGSKNEKITHIVVIMSRAGPSEIDERSEKKGFHLSKRDDPKGGVREFKLPYYYFKDAQKYDVLEAIKDCTKPKLFIAGKKDEIIKPALVHDTFEKCVEPKQIADVDSEHDYRYHPEIVEEVEGIIDEFLGI